MPDGRDTPKPTVTEAALIDFQRGREALMTRARNFDPQKDSYEPGDLRIPPEYVDSMTLPTRIEIDYRHPVHIRQQLDILASAIVEAQVVTQQHELGINRQRIRCREILKTAADMLTIVNGKTPAGRRRRKMIAIQDQQERQGV